MLPLIRHFLKVSKQQIRHLKLLEYQNIALLKEHGISVQNYCVVDELSDKDFETFNANEYVVKAQILSTQRKYGHFSNGYEGGIRFTKDRVVVRNIVKNMLGCNLVTRKSPPGGFKVDKVMITERVKIVRKIYLCIMLDSDYGGPIFVVCPTDGEHLVDIALKEPCLIQSFPLNISEPISDSLALTIAHAAKYSGDMAEKLAGEVKSMWTMFQRLDMLLLTIDQFVETSDEQFVAISVKMRFDNNAKFRQKRVFDLNDCVNAKTLEAKARKYNFKYMNMDGNIGCLVNGTGYAMTTIDILAIHGGKPALIIQVRGNVYRVERAFQTLCQDQRVKVVLVNIFGGMVNCAIVAKGIVQTCEIIKPKSPIVARLMGNNEDEARRIIEDSSWRIEMADSLEDVAKKAVGYLNL